VTSAAAWGKAAETKRLFRYLAATSLKSRFWIGGTNGDHTVNTVPQMSSQIPHCGLNRWRPVVFGPRGSGFRTV